MTDEEKLERIHKGVLCLYTRTDKTKFVFKVAKVADLGDGCRIKIDYVEVDSNVTASDAHKYVPHHFGWLDLEGHLDDIDIALPPSDGRSIADTLDWEED